MLSFLFQNNCPILKEKEIHSAIMLPKNHESYSDMNFQSSSKTLI